MKYRIRRRESGDRFGSFFVLENEQGQKVASTPVEPFGFSTGYRALEIYCAENGLTLESKQARVQR